MSRNRNPIDTQRERAHEKHLTDAYDATVRAYCERPSRAAFIRQLAAGRCTPEALYAYRSGARRVAPSAMEALINACFRHGQEWIDRGEQLRKLTLQRQK